MSSLQLSDLFTDILDDSLTLGLFSDVTLVSSDEKRFLAHKVVLSASSFILKNIFMENNDDGLALLFADTDGTMLKALVYYIYLGTVELSADYVPNFSLLVENLGMKPISVESMNGQQDLPEKLNVVDVTTNVHKQMYTDINIET